MALTKVSNFKRSFSDYARRQSNLGSQEESAWINGILDMETRFVLIFFPHQPLISSEIIRVVDGDSIIVYLNGDPTQVRLACIDAPEIGQYPYGRLAMNTFRGLLPADSTVKITPVREDRYGRTIGHVMTPRGVDVAEELVSRGLAFVLTRDLLECDGPKLLLLESQAQNARKGFWSEARHGITRPWIYRRGYSKREKCSNISSLKKAQILLQEGHVYLDRDNDGRACERFFDFN